METTPAIKQVSETDNSKICGVCGDGISNNIGHLQLKCECQIHYSCLVLYIRSKSSISISQHNGIICPYTITGDCSRENGDFFILTSDLHLLAEYYDHNVTEDIAHLDPVSARMTQAEVEKICSWVTDVPEELTEEVSLYTKATTKACPSCKIRTSHFSGHGCHHVMGCPNCGIHWCYKCEATEIENTEQRGARNVCLCGGWSSFCSTSVDVPDYIAALPYPHDKRCGCPICPECKLGAPCGSCSGECVVCLGHCSSGPVTLVGDGEWTALTPSMLLIYAQKKYDLFVEALVTGNVTATTRLLGNSPEFVNIADPLNNGSTPLHVAAEKGFADIIEVILGYDRADVNCVNDAGDTPLSLAIKYSQEKAVQILAANAHCDINIVNANGVTPLLQVMTGLPLAAVRIHSWIDSVISIVDSLLQHPDIKINDTLGNGKTALFMAFDRPHFARSIIAEKLIMHPSIDLDHRDSGGMTALMHAASNQLSTAVSAILSNEKWTHNKFSVDNQGRTDLMHACMSGNVDVVEAFMAHVKENSYAVEVEVGNFLREDFGEDAALQLLLSNEEWTTADIATTDLPVLAILSSQDRRAQVLSALQKGAEDTYINMMDAAGKTALDYAIDCGNVAVVKKLVDCPFLNVNGSKGGRIPFDTTLARKNDLLTSILLAREDMTTYLIVVAGSLESTLILCAKYGMVRSVNALLDKEGIDIHYRDAEGKGAIEHAIENGFIEIVNLLLPHTSCSGNTVVMQTCHMLKRPMCSLGHPLTLCSQSSRWSCDGRHEKEGCVCGSGKHRVVSPHKRYRCAMGCNLSYCEPCIGKKFPDIKSEILQMIIGEASVDDIFIQTDCSGMTAFFHAIAMGNLDTLRLLLSKCRKAPDVLLRSYSGNSALSIAIFHNRFDVINMIIEFISLHGSSKVSNLISPEVGDDAFPKADEHIGNNHQEKLEGLETSNHTRFEKENSHKQGLSFSNFDPPVVPNVACCECHPGHADAEARIQLFRICGPESRMSSECCTILEQIQIHISERNESALSRDLRMIRFLLTSESSNLSSTAYKYVLVSVMLVLKLFNDKKAWLGQAATALLFMLFQNVQKRLDPSIFLVWTNEVAGCKSSFSDIYHVIAPQSFDEQAD